MATLVNYTCKRITKLTPVNSMLVLNFAILAR